MKVLIGCERSGVVREAFRARGHDAWSCDLLPADDNSPYHIQEDVLDWILNKEWDLGIFHPPCTYLAVSGARWFKERQTEQKEALVFVRKLMAARPFVDIQNASVTYIFQGFDLGSLRIKGI